jgi:hypothetical protein
LSLDSKGSATSFVVAKAFDNGDDDSGATAQPPVKTPRDSAPEVSPGIHKLTTPLKRDPALLAQARAGERVPNEPVLDSPRPLNRIYVGDVTQGQQEYFNTGNDPDITARELQRLSKSLGFEVQRLPIGNPWIEDSGIVLNNQSALVYEGDAEVAFGAHSIISLPDARNTGSNGLGARYSKQLGDALEERGWRVKRTDVFLEGGNVLMAANAQGRNLAVIGRGSLYANMVMLDKAGKLDITDVARLATSKQWSPAELARGRQFVKTLLEDPAASPAENERTVRETLAKLELTHRHIAKELNLPQDRVVFVTQNGGHVDMEARPGPDGTFFVNDPRQSLKLLNDVLVNNKLPAYERSVVQTLLSLQREQFTPEVLNSLDAQAKELEAAGFKVVRAPLNLGDPTGSVAAITPEKVNFANGVMGENKASGDAYYLTNAAPSAPAVQRAFAAFMKQHGVEQTHFFPSTGKLIDLGGGLDCITHAP